MNWLLYRSDLVIKVYYYRKALLYGKVIFISGSYILIRFDMRYLYGKKMNWGWWKEFLEKKDVCHYNAQYFTKIQKGKKENDETELSY